MSDTTTLPLSDIETFKTKALQWANHFPTLCLLDSNAYPHDRYTAVEWILAVDSIASHSETEDGFISLKTFISESTEMVFGYLGYNLKDKLERLHTRHADPVGFPDMYFFRPRYILQIANGRVTINRNYPEAAQLYDLIMQQPNIAAAPSMAIDLQSRTSRTDYLSQVATLREQIAAGDFYEINYCCEWYAEGADLNPIEVFEQLNKRAKAPFSTFFKLNNSYLLCASPERFMARRGGKLISQPIKGTIRKGCDESENKQLKTELQTNAKERAENIMIVDLVRNDLARSAQTGTVVVEELCGVYAFETVNQMISTVTAQIDTTVHSVDALLKAFPMGSMTGAPKVEVMKTIDVIEDMNRGLYSGSVGYFSPTGDFDFNVVIRSIFYHSASKYLSIKTGSAITYQSTPEDEYEELLLKAEAMHAVLK